MQQMIRKIKTGREICRRSDSRLARAELQRLARSMPLMFVTRAAVEQINIRKFNEQPDRSGDLDDNRTRTKGLGIDTAPQVSTDVLRACFLNSIVSDIFSRTSPKSTLSGGWSRTIVAGGPHPFAATQR
jgi:hypothetical protein